MTTARRTGWTLALVSAALFMVTLDNLVVTTALPSIHHDLGWTPERLAAMFPGTLKHHLAPLDTSGQFFNYDPMV